MRTSALGFPRREENPAASTTIFNLGKQAFVAMIGKMDSSRVNLRHRPFLTPIYITAGAAGTAFLFALFWIWIWIWGTSGSTTLIVTPEDPGAGEERAALLARMLGAQGPGGLDAIYVSSLPRNRLIASRLAERLRITPRDAPETDASSLAQRALREHGGARVLIIAEPNLFAGVVEALSGIRGVPAPAAGDYGVIYVVTVPRIGHANLLRLNY
jgi:hypothetical protein